MARGKTPNDLTISILEGSEEIFDFFCQPCSSDQYLEAAGYCKNCSQYLCITCIKCHGKLTATEHHTVLEKSAMPKKTTPKVRNTDMLTEKCRKHPDKVLEYFCETHDQICCSVCITLDHSFCSDRSYIPDISDGIANSQEYHKLKIELDRLLGELTKRQEKISNGDKNNKKYHTKALSDIKEFRKRINELLDKIEEDTMQKVAKFHQENVVIIGRASENCQSLLSEVKSMASDMDEQATAGKNNQFFVTVKMFCNQIAGLDKLMKENGECKITQYAFNQDDRLQMIISTLSAIFSLPVRQDDTPTKAHYLREINVKAEDDKEECSITGLTVLSNDHMATTDEKNMNVKLIDMKMNKIVSRLSVSSEPFDITVFKLNQVAVALGNEEKIAIITASDIMTTTRTIETPDAIIVGLCYNGSYFIAACQRPASIKIITLCGKTLSTISTGVHDRQLFTTPQYITLGPGKDVAYVSDLDNNTVTCLTLSGRVIWVYRHDILKYPLGVAVGKDGTVYVCSRGTDTVHQLASTGGLIRIILGLDQGLAHNPETITYGDDDNKLYISSYSSKPGLRNSIRLYQLD